MTTRELIAGAVAFPVVVALAFVEPALGLVAGFAVFVGGQKALSTVHRPRPHSQPEPAENLNQRLAA